MPDSNFTILLEVKKVIQNKYNFNQVDGTREFWSTTVLPHLSVYAKGIISTMVYDYAYKKEIVTTKDTLPKYLVDM